MKFTIGPLRKEIRHEETHRISPDHRSPDVLASPGLLREKQSPLPLSRRRCRLRLRNQEHVARRMLEWYGEKPYQVVLMLGDNIYGKGGKAGATGLCSEEFDKYYKPLIDHGVKFYAAVETTMWKPGRR